MQENMDFGYFPNNKYLLHYIQNFALICVCALSISLSNLPFWKLLQDQHYGLPATATLLVSAGISHGVTGIRQAQGSGSHVCQMALAFCQGPSLSPSRPLISSRLEWAHSHDDGSVPKQQNPNVKALIEPLFTSHVLMVYWLKQVTFKPCMSM